MFYEDVFRTLNEYDVKYSVAGELALNLHGAPRATQDLDLLLEMTESNIRTAVESLINIKFESDLPVDPKDFANPEKRRQWIETRNMKAFTLTRPHQSLQSVDFLFDLSLDYSDCSPNVVKMESDDFTIPVISVEDLITLKEKAGREIDELDVEMLQKIREFDNE